MRQRQQEARGGLAWPRRCPLFDESWTLVGYVLSVLAIYLTLIGVEAASAPVTVGDALVGTAGQGDSIWAMDAATAAGQGVLPLAVSCPSALQSVRPSMACWMRSAATR